LITDEGVVASRAVLERGGSSYAASRVYWAAWQRGQNDRVDRFLAQALRFEQAAKNAADPNTQRVYEELAQLWRKLAERLGALRDRVD
jgi:hypothetical protein